MRSLVLIKIGGGLITDKTKPLTVREDMMLAAAEGIKLALRKNQGARFIIGNGAGSFGHYLASETTPLDPQARIDGIHQSVVMLNELFTGFLRDAGLDVVSVIPASCISARNGELLAFNMQPIEKAFDANVLPVLFGDIVADGTEKGMIFSTETLLETVALRLHADFELEALYVGEAEGVLDRDGVVIPEISIESWKKMGGIIEAPVGYDVTGGMQHKIEKALKMAQLAKNVRIISGKNPKNIAAALSGGRIGTKIVA